MNNIDKQYKELLKTAKSARDMSYCPYSGFAVGAALLTKSGKVYVGANIENASYSATICAERVAISKAISEGEMDFAAIAIVGARRENNADEPCTPCGVCRQFISEFADSDFKIVLSDKEGYSAYSLDEILPLRFTKDKL